MSHQQLFTSTLSTVYSELDPGMYVTAEYTTTNNDVQRSVLKEIERELLAIPYDAKVKSVDKPLNNTQETLEDNIYYSTNPGTSKPNFTSKQSCSIKEQVSRHAKNIKLPEKKQARKRTSQKTKEIKETSRTKKPNPCRRKEQINETNSDETNTKKKKNKEKEFGCLLGCKDITEETRDSLFQHFHNLSNQGKREWIVNASRKVPIKRRRSTTNRRRFNYQYFININEDRQRVCLQFISATLGLSQNFVYYTLEHAEEGSARCDMRGKHVPSNITPLALMKEVQQFIKSSSAFVSEYNQNNSKKMSISQLYRIYLKHSDGKKVSVSVFRRVFNIINIGSNDERNEYTKSIGLDTARGAKEIEEEPVLVAEEEPVDEPLDSDIDVLVQEEPVDEQLDGEVDVLVQEEPVDEPLYSEVDVLVQEEQVDEQLDGEIDVLVQGEPVDKSLYSEVDVLGQKEPVDEQLDNTQDTFNIFYNFNNLNETVLSMIERESSVIPCDGKGKEAIVNELLEGEIDVLVKEKPCDEPLDNAHETLEDYNMYNCNTPGTSKSSLTSRQSCSIKEQVTRHAKNIKFPKKSLKKQERKRPKQKTKDIKETSRTKKPNPCRRKAQMNETNSDETNTKKKKKEFECLLACKYISEETRDSLFKNFHSLNNQGKREWIVNASRKVPIKRRRSTTNRRRFNYQYFINNNEDRQRVCLQFISATLGLRQNFVYYTLEHAKEGSARFDMRGKHAPSNKTPLALMKEVQQFIKSSSALVSDYNQNNSKKMSVSQLHKIYLQHSDGKKVSVSVFRKVFNNIDCIYERDECTNSIRLDIVCDEGKNPVDEPIDNTQATLEEDNIFYNINTPKETVLSKIEPESSDISSNVKGNDEAVNKPLDSEMDVLAQEETVDEPLDCEIGVLVRENTFDEPLDNIQETLEKDNIYNTTTPGTSKSKFTSKQSCLKNTTLSEKNLIKQAEMKPKQKTKNIKETSKTKKPNPCRRKEQMNEINSDETNTMKKKEFECLLGCKDISEETRDSLFQHFHSLNNQGKREWIINASRKVPIKKNRSATNRRKFNYQYFINNNEDRQRVCLQFISATLGLCSNFVYYTLKHAKVGSAKCDMRVRHAPCNKTSLALEKEVQQFIKSSSALVSDYNQKKSKRMSVSQLYRIYLNHSGGKKVSAGVFRRVFNTHNIDCNDERDECTKTIGLDIAYNEEELVNELLDSGIEEKSVGDPLDNEIDVLVEEEPVEEPSDSEIAEEEPDDDPSDSEVDILAEEEPVDELLDSEIDVLAEEEPVDHPSDSELDVLVEEQSVDDPLYSTQDILQEDFNNPGTSKSNFTSKQTCSIKKQVTRYAKNIKLPKKSLKKQARKKPKQKTKEIKGTSKAKKPNPCRRKEQMNETNSYKTNTKKKKEFKCSLACKDINEETRDRLFQHFHRLNNQGKREWIINASRKVPIKRRRGTTNRRRFNYHYFINNNEDRQRVCLQFILATLGLSQKFVYYTLEHAEKGSARCDMRGKHAPSNKTPLALEKEMQQFIESWSRMPSLYEQKESKKMSISQLYRIYLKHSGGKKVSGSVFRRVFNINKNDCNDERDECTKTIGLDIAYNASEEEEDPVYDSLESQIDESAEEEPVDDPLESTHDTLEEDFNNPGTSISNFTSMQTSSIKKQVTRHAMNIKLPKKILKKQAKKRPEQKTKEIKGTSKTKKPNPCRRKTQMNETNSGKTNTKKKKKKEFECLLGCKDISEETRDSLFQHFHSLNNQGKWEWIINASRKVPIKRRRSTTYRRRFNYHYFINNNGDRQRVCLQFISATLGLRQNFVYYTLEHAEEGSAKCDMRGRHTSRNKTPLALEKEVQQFIRNSSELASDYFIKKSKKMSLSQLYRIYLKQSDGVKVSLKVFRKVFNTNNIGCNDQRKTGEYTKTLGLDIAHNANVKGELVNELLDRAIEEEPVDDPLDSEIDVLAEKEPVDEPLYSGIDVLAEEELVDEPLDCEIDVLAEEEPIDEPLESDMDILAEEEPVDDPLDSTQDILEDDLNTSGTSKSNFTSKQTCSIKKQVTRHAKNIKLPKKSLIKQARKRPEQKTKEIKGTSKTKKPNPCRRKEKMNETNSDKTNTKKKKEFECLLGCKDISEETRDSLFQHFHSLNNQGKREWIINASRKVPIKRRRSTTYRRRFNYHYFINNNGDRQRVCLQFISATLGLRQNFVYYTLEHAEEGSPKCDMRGRHTSRNKTSLALEKEIQQFVRSSSELASDYFIKKSKKMILSKLYRIYLKQSDGVKVSLKIFRKVFNTNNIGCDDQRKSDEFTKTIRLDIAHNAKEKGEEVVNELLDSDIDELVKEEPVEPLDSDIDVLEEEPVDEPLDSEIDILAEEETVDDPLDSEIDVLAEEEPVDEQLDSEIDVLVKGELIDEPFVSEIDVEEELLNTQDTFAENVLAVQSVKQEKVNNAADCSNDEYCSSNEDSMIYSVNTHLKQTTDKKLHYSCDYCSKAFSNKFNLKTHLLIHKGIIVYSCAKCPKSFSRITCLNTHLLTHEKTYICDKCSKSFSNKVSIKTHLLTHEGIRHPCVKCSKSYSNKDSLRAHQLTHEGIKYPCDMCSKSFVDKSNFRKHLRLHKGIRYSCDKCPKSFSNNVSLKEHQLLHKGVTHTCNVCVKSFSSRCNLKRHLLSHQGVWAPL